MRILVTGGAGFIGSHLVETLLERGHSVDVLDNLTNGNKRNLEGVMDRIQFIHGNILDDDDMRGALNGVDAVAHLAALINAEESMKKPQDYHLVNAAGTLKVVQHSVSMNVKRLVFTSSCAVYGEPFRVPITEDDPVAPISYYADSKLDAEAHCENFTKSGRMNITIFRLFNVYGPRQGENPYAATISKFIETVRWGNVIHLFGDGGQTRDYIFVRDVTKFIAAALEKDLVGLFNLGFGQPITTKQLAETISVVMGRKKLKIDYKPKKQEDVQQSAADITKLVNTFGMRPEVSLEQGLSMTIRRSQ